MSELHRLGLVGIAAGLLACAPPPPVCDGCRYPDAQTLQHNAGHAFLVRRLRFEAPPPLPCLELSWSPVTAPVSGLDIDGLDSGTGSRAGDANCAQWMDDFVSPLDPAITGVDNAGAGLRCVADWLRLDVDIEEVFDEASRSGDIRWAVRVGEPRADAPGLVLLEVYAVESGDPIELDEEGYPAPDQVLRARRVGQTIAAISDRVAFGIFEVPSTGALAQPPEGSWLPLDELRLEGVSVAMSEDATSIEGELAASFSSASLADRVVEIAPEVSELAREFFESIADLDPRPTDPYVCDRLSLGLSFEAVPVELLTE